MRIWCRDSSCPCPCESFTNEGWVRHEKGEEAGNSLIAQARETTHDVVCCGASGIFLPDPEEAGKFLEKYGF
jgi:hypothetical protein